jgi:tetraacyldisaccharide 4'-kinase
MKTRKYLFLYPISLIYRLITDFRNMLFDCGILKSKEFPVPVICVGNLTAGGTGKTPHIEYIIDLLRRDLKISVLSRGYKRRSKGFIVAEHTSTVSDIGDEPTQIKRKFSEIVVCVNNNRREGIRKILRLFPETNVILMDDGFQHRWVKPGVSIIITDYNRLITRDHILPFGRLRENKSNRKRAGIIIVSKVPDQISNDEINDIAGELKYDIQQKVFFTSFSYGPLLPLFNDGILEEMSLNITETGVKETVLITGIAFPQPLKKHIEKYFKNVIHLEFPDHHYFSKKDIEKISSTFNGLKSEEKILITTEKDAARLREFINIENSLKGAFYYIPVKVRFLNNKQEFDNLISEYVGKNNRGD